LFSPEKYFASITSINIEWDLVRAGVETVFLDIDNTILRRDNHEVPFAVREWMAKAQEKGIKLCLLSNNFHQSVHVLAQELNLPIIAKAMKPLPFGYIRAMGLVGAQKETSVMVGDQLFTDVLGAHVVGMAAYLVCPLVEEDLKHTLLLRQVERIFLPDQLPEREPYVPAPEVLSSNSESSN
jgi:hypothetical protein